MLKTVILSVALAFLKKMDMFTCNYVIILKGFFNVDTILTGLMELF